MNERLKKSGRIVLMLILSGFPFLNESCQNSGMSAEKSVKIDFDQFKNSDEKSAYINFRSFQNSDLTWGFTIFVNSMPFRHYTRIPYRNADEGFTSRNEAEEVANLFIKMIRNGNTSPKLDKRTVDSLKITLNR